MSISITKPTVTEESKRTQNLYDNYDNLISVIKYDNNENVEYVLKPDGTAAGQASDTRKYNQIQVDINRSVVDITAESATLRARIYKNESSKVYATGFIYWSGNSNDSVIGKPDVINNFSTPFSFKGNFAYNISNLQDNTTYNYRAFVRHEYGTNYSPVAQFTTINFASIFSIVGQRYSGPAPFTFTLSAVNAGPGDYTYAWNMTGGPIRFEYSLNGINIALSGAGYTPKATNYSLNSVVVTTSGFGYFDSAKTNVLVNGIHFDSLSANFQRETTSFGISSVTVPVALSGFKTNTFVITFSSSNDSSISTVASGVGTAGNYQVDRVTAVLVDGIYQPTLVVGIGRDEDTGIYGVSGVKFTSGPLTGYTTSSRTVLISSNGPVDQTVTYTLSTTIQYKDTDYLTRVITHTHLSGGNYIAKCYAILNGDQIEKDAIRTIRVTTGADFTPQWANILNVYGDSIIAAYDHRQWAGSIDLNEYPVGLWNFEPENVNINIGFGGNPIYGCGQHFIDSLNRFSGEGIVGGYLYFSNQFGLPRTNIGGYFSQEEYNARLFGPGIIGRAARFDPVPVGGYGQSWSSSSVTYAFNRGQPFTLSMWVNYNQFIEPGSNSAGTRIFSVWPNNDWWNSKEFGITQSTAGLSIFRNIPYSESFSPYEPIAGYKTGYPVLSTNDSAKMLTANTWNHMVITRGYNNNYKYYKNGILALSGTGNLGGYSAGYGFNDLPEYQPSWNNFAGYCSFNVGGTKYYNTYTGAPSGFIDSVGLWAKEFSQTDVEDLYAGGAGTDEFGYLNPVVGPNMWLGGLVGSNQWGSFGQINTRPETTGDPYWDKVSLLVKFDGADGSLNFTDSSTNNVSLSSSGAKVSTSIKRFGTGSALISGVNNTTGYIQTASGADWGEFGRGDFTIEWWEYFDPAALNNSTTSQFQPVIFYGMPALNNGNGGSAPAGHPYPAWGIYYTYYSNNSYYLRFVGRDRNKNNTVQVQWNDIAPTGGTWTHNVIQRTTTGTYFNTVYSYHRNGQLVGWTNEGTQLPTNFSNLGVSLDDLPTTPTSPNTFSDANALSAVYGTGSIGSAYILIGGYPGGPWRLFPGYIDELRVTKGVARYPITNNFNPVLSAFATSYGTNIGTRYQSNSPTVGSYAAAKNTVPVTIPHTMVFVGKTNALQTSETTFQNIQPFKYFINSEAQKLTLDAFPWLGVRGSPQFGVQGIPGFTIPGNSFRGGYVPTGVGGYGNEWMYLACSFLGQAGNNQIRYYLKTPTLSGQGTIGGYPNSVPFNGFPMFGSGGGISPVAGYSAINGVVRLGMHLNRSFNTDEMISLFKAVTAGPAADIEL